MLDIAKVAFLKALVEIHRDEIISMLKQFDGRIITASEASYKHSWDKHLLECAAVHEELCSMLNTSK